MEHNIKGFTNEIQEQKSILIDIGLIIEFGLRDYKEYLKSLFYEPMSLKTSAFIRHLYYLSETRLEEILQKL
jgi:hypothetical protein